MALSPVTPAGARTIATYDDYRRAVGAVEHLSVGPPIGRLHLVLSDFRAMRTAPESGMRNEARRAILPTALGAVGAVLLGGSLGLLRLTVSLPLLVAFIIGVIATSAAVLAVLRGARRGLPIPSTRLVPQKYEVRCTETRRTTAAEAALAAWWLTGLDGEPRTVDHRRVLRTVPARTSAGTA